MPPRRTLIAQRRFGASLALVALLAACGSKAEPPIVVWLEVDTLRADVLGCYGNTERGEGGCEPSPSLDRLAQDSVRFERAYSVAPWTLPSLVSQLCGKWPWEHGDTHLMERVGEAHTELVPLLRSRGLRTAGVMTNFVVTSSQGFDAGFERWDESTALGHTGSYGREALAKLLAMADELAPAAPQGLLLFGWLFEPHYLYEQHPGLRFGPGFGDRAHARYPGPLQGREDLTDLQRRRATLTADDREFLRGNYMSEVAEVDRAIGGFLDGLKQRGLYDRAWIVVTADHGEEVLERGWIGHSVTLHDELVRVPLLVKPPKDVACALRGKSVPHAVSLIDLPATLHAMATGREPDRAKRELGHSRSLLPVVLEGARPERRWLYLHTDFRPFLQDDMTGEKSADQWGVVDAERRLKWIVDRKVDATPRASLFELDADPRELRDVAREPRHAQTATELQRLRALVPTPLAGDLPAPPWLPEEPWGPRPAARAGFGPGFPEGGR
jgi:arylsulfatase